MKLPNTLTLITKILSWTAFACLLFFSAVNMLAAKYLQPEQFTPIATKLISKQLGVPIEIEEATGEWSLLSPNLDVELRGVTISRETFKQVPADLRKEILAHYNRIPIIDKIEYKVEAKSMFSPEIKLRDIKVRVANYKLDLGDDSMPNFLINKKRNRAALKSLVRRMVLKSCRQFGISDSDIRRMVSKPR